MSIVVYRYEDKSGRGPYRPGFSSCWVSRSRDGPPPPWVEAGLSIEQYLRLFTPGMQGGCACISRKQLGLWFNLMERRRLANLGYRLVKFVPDRIVLQTPTQVVFERQAA